MAKQPSVKQIAARAKFKKMVKEQVAKRAVKK